MINSAFEKLYKIVASEEKIVKEMKDVGNMRMMIVKGMIEQKLGKIFRTDVIFLGRNSDRMTLKKLKYQ
jgi:hypothetical protein